jgi:hypothetical protein
MQLPQPAPELFKFTIFCWSTASCLSLKFVSSQVLLTFVRCCALLEGLARLVGLFGGF